MLHLVFQSPIDNSLLQRISSDDDVVFFESSIFSLLKKGLLSDELETLIKSKSQLYSLKEDIKTRGLSQEELVTGIQIIDYPALVKLTEKNKLIKTWR